MLFAVAALLFQLQVAPQPSFSAVNAARVSPASVAISAKPVANEPVANEPEANEKALPSAPVAADTSSQLVAEANSDALPDAPVPVLRVHAAPIAFINPGRPFIVSVGELQSENRQKLRVWKGLAIASHGAATFDAWTTRHAIGTSGAHELNPMLRPFAGNASLYAVIQIGPALMDYAGRKMMYSQHTWVRRLWWVPQSASFVSSLFCGAHNLSVQ